MTAHKQRHLDIAAVANACGQTFIDVAQKMAPAASIEIVAIERFAATDTSFVAQGVKLVGASPDAVLVAAAGKSAALPQIELKQRNFTGTVFQTQAVANNDFLRIGGKDVEGTRLPVSPLIVAEQLPDSNPVIYDFLLPGGPDHGLRIRGCSGALEENWDDAIVFHSCQAVTP